MNRKKTYTKNKYNLNLKIIHQNQMNILFLMLLFWFLNYQSAFSKETRLFFKSTNYETVTIYSPNDDYINNFEVPSLELKLSPNIEVCYSANIVDFAFIQISNSAGSRYSLLIHDGDSLHVNFDNGILKFTGTNSFGQVYLNNFSKSINIDSIFSQHLIGGVKIYNINQDIKSLFLNRIRGDINDLIFSKKISFEFGEKIYKDMNYAVADMFVRSCIMLLKGVRKVNLNKTDTLILRNSLDSIFKIIPPDDKDIIKYRYSYMYINNYYSLQYDMQLENQRNALIKDYSENTFGPYLNFLLAPDYIQAPILGSAFLIQLNYNVNEFDKSKMHKYLEQKFPASQYFKIINEKYKNVQKQDNNKELRTFTKEINYIEKSINSLEELSLLPELSGKYIFIDIWATWCVPCKMQFQYNEKLDSLAKKYNISLVYISLDNKEFENKWKSDIENIGIKGNHLLANENLKKSIQKEIFDNKKVTIPRYFILNKNGNIIKFDAPRPSNINELERCLHELSRIP